MVFSPFERMVAVRYLRARRQEGFISVIAWFSLLGIALGVATLIIVMSVMNGFREELLGRILGLNGHVSVQGQGHALGDFDELAARIRKLPGVVGVIPQIDGQAMATARTNASGAVVRGIRPEDLKALTRVSSRIVAGSLDQFDDDAVAIGYRLAARLGVAPGAEVSLITPEGAVTAFGTIPRIKTYHVVAIFNVGMYEYDSTFLYLPLAAAQLYFRLPSAVSELEVRIDSADHATAMASQIRLATGPGVVTYTWEQVNGSFFNAVQVERNVMFLILTLIIVVAAFNIISSLIMLVKDKGRDIAILRTMGATRGMIMRIFLLSGASVGFIGTVAGLALGMAFCDNIETIRQWLQSLTGTELFSPEIYFLSQLPAVVDPREVTLVVLMGFGLSFLATLYPSWRAARLDPVEALRYE